MWIEWNHDSPAAKELRKWVLLLIVVFLFGGFINFIPVPGIFFLQPVALLFVIFRIVKAAKLVQEEGLQRQDKVMKKTEAADPKMDAIHQQIQQEITLDPEVTRKIFTYLILGGVTFVFVSFLPGAYFLVYYFSMEHVAAAAVVLLLAYLYYQYAFLALKKRLEQRK